VYILCAKNITPYKIFCVQISKSDKMEGHNSTTHDNIVGPSKLTFFTRSL